MAKVFCIFSAHYLPKIGGVERYTYNLAKHLVKRGYKVIVVTSNVFNLKDYEESEGIAVYRLPCFNMLKGRFPVLKPNIKFFSMNKRLREEKIDNVIINTKFYIHSLYGAWFAKKKQVKGILIEHVSSHLTIHNKFFDYLGGVFEHLLTVLIKLKVKDFYGVSAYVNDWLAHFCIKSKGIVTNAVDLEEINSIIENSAINFAKTYNLPKDVTIIAFAGRLLKEKGILELVAAAEILSDAGEKFCLFIAGDGDLYDYLADLNLENIVLLGSLDFTKVISLFSQADIFCLPSYGEGFSSVLIEAAACEAYCITADVGIARELVLDDSYGTILEKITPREIAKEITNAIRNPHVRYAAAKKCCERVKQRFCWTIACDEVINIFEANKKIQVK